MAIGDAISGSPGFQFRAIGLGKEASLMAMSYVRWEYHEPMDLGATVFSNKAMSLAVTIPFS